MDDDNVIHGSFGRHPFGTSVPGMHGIGSVQGDTPVDAAGQPVQAGGRAGLEAQHARIMATLQRLERHAQDADASLGYAERLSQLKEVAERMGATLAQEMQSDEGFIAVQTDLNTLGAQVAELEESVTETEGALPEVLSEEALPPELRRRARRKFPWGWLALGVLSLAGLVWVFRSQRPSSGLSGGFAKGRVAP